MKLNNVKTISKEELAKKGEIPKWIDPMLEVLNSFITQVTQALTGNLTFEDNFLCKLIDQDFTHSEELIVNPDLPGRTGLRPYGVIPVSASGEDVDSLEWRLLDSGKIGITLSFGSSVTATCKLLILLR